MARKPPPRPGRKAPAQELADYQKVLDKHNKKYPPQKAEWVPSGSLVLDYVWGMGFPVNKVTVLSSAPALGKTTVAVSTARGILESAEGLVLYLDAESGLDESLVNNVIGEELKSRFIIHTPPTYEAVEEMIQDYTATTTRLLAVIIDSVTALQTEKVLKEGDARIGSKAGYEALFCIKMKLWSATNKFGVIYVNQQRANISMTGRGPATRPAGGFALHHYCDIEMQLRNMLFIKNSQNDKLGVCARVFTDKNRMVGNRSAPLYIRYGVGVSNVTTLESFLKHTGRVTQGGAYFKIKIEELNIEKSVQGNVGLNAFVQEYFVPLLELMKNSPEQCLDYYEKYKP